MKILIYLFVKLGAGVFQVSRVIRLVAWDRRSNLFSDEYLPELRKQNFSTNFFFFFRKKKKSCSFCYAHSRNWTVPSSVFFKLFLLDVCLDEVERNSGNKLLHNQKTWYLLLERWKSLWKCASFPYIKVALQFICPFKYSGLKEICHFEIFFIIKRKKKVGNR